MDKGWIKLNRQIQDHWIWNNPEKLKAWLDLLMLANVHNKKSDMREGLVIIKRGQYVTSIGKLSERWHWSRERVRRFLNTLERDGMITRKSDSFKTTVTIVNYNKFQSARHSDETPDETPNKSSDETPDEIRLKNIKKDKESKEDSATTSDEVAAVEEDEEGVGMTLEEWEALEDFV